MERCCGRWSSATANTSGDAGARGHGAARTRADELGIPLFVMALTGMLQPVNDPADGLVAAGA
ncbi:hypothetical protein DRB89_37510 [Streptomyces sp. ICC4]|nr:hypothetical protein DRB89_37510 [Streptomyces sp. ICC4]